MTSEYTVEAYTPAHRNAVRRLLGQVLPHRSEELLDRYFTWKYEQNPYIDHPLLAVVLADGEPIAVRGLCGTSWTSADGEAITVPAAEDLVIDIAHRDRGLFLMLDKTLTRLAVEQGHPWLVSLSAHNEATQKLQLVTRWEHTATLHVSMRRTRRPLGPIRSKPFVRKVVGKTMNLAGRAGLGESFDTLLAPTSTRPTAVRLSPDPDIDAMASLARRGPGPALAPSRNAQFYRWRLANPDRRYHFLTWEDSSVRGFLVLSRLRPPSRQVRILDSGAENPEVMHLMLGALFGADRPDFVMARHAVPAEPTDLGFGSTAEEFVKIFRKPTKRNATLPDEAVAVDLLDTMLV